MSTPFESTVAVAVTATLHENHGPAEHIVGPSFQAVIDEAVKVLGPLMSESRVTAAGLIEGQTKQPTTSSGYALYHQRGRSVITSSRMV